MTNPVKKPFVFAKKSAWLQRTQDLVRNGHCFYVTGTIMQEKAEGLALKLATAYETELLPMAQSRKRSRGEASFRLLSWSDENAQVMHWILLHTDGVLPDCAAREKWQDAAGKTRLAVVGGYELVRLVKPLSPKPVWTWRYSKYHFEGLQDSIKRAIRNRRDDLLTQLIYEISRTMGFAGARVQVKSLYNLIENDWKRTRGYDPIPDLPKHIGYIQRLPNKPKPIKSSKGASQKTENKAR